MKPGTASLVVTRHLADDGSHDLAKEPLLDTPENLLYPTPSLSAIWADRLLAVVSFRVDIPPNAIPAIAESANPVAPERGEANAIAP